MLSLYVVDDEAIEIIQSLVSPWAPVAARGRLAPMPTRRAASRPSRARPAAPRRAARRPASAHRATASGPNWGGVPRWETKSPHIHVAFCEIVVHDMHGRPRRAKVALRVDARERPIRVDYAPVVNGAWMPFEAIDGGRGVGSMTTGKQLARAWWAARQA